MAGPPSEPIRQLLKAIGASDDEIDSASGVGPAALVALGARHLVESYAAEHEPTEEREGAEARAEPQAPPAPEDDSDVIELLRAIGVPGEEIERARAVGGSSLMALVTDKLFVPGDERLTRREVSARSGIDAEEASVYWRALGFADVGDDDPIFTEADVEMLRLLKGLLSSGFVDRELALQMTRVMGRSLAGVAAAQVDTVRRMASGLPAPAARHQAVMALVQTRGMLLDVIERAIVYIWRRHLAAEAKRTALTLESSTAQGDVVVGFADLVGFTALSAQMDEATLASAVSRFESKAVEIVGSLSGRVVKMIGDEVMFESVSAADGVETALRLVEAFDADESLPDLRAGLAEGLATPYQGDLYGPAPNLAHRLVDVALPATVLVSESVRDTAEGDERFEFRPVRPQTLKGFGRTRFWVARRPR